MNDINIKIIDVGITDPYKNLALEELLFNTLALDERILFIWQNDNAVVVGNNQCVYTQCSVDYASQHGVKLCRRKSGGGAVFHDIGNINYSFITPYNTEWKKVNCAIVIDALASIGINAELNGRNDIIHNERKISGNAYYSDDNKICHHGTVLINTNIDLMTKLLSVDKEKWNGKGVDSVRSRVVNLSEITDKIDVDTVKESLKKAFITFYLDASVSEFNDLNEIVSDEQKLFYSALYSKYSSNYWVYGKNIDANFRTKKKFQWGLVEVLCSINDDSITDVQIISDALDAELISSISCELNGRRFFTEEINIAADKIRNHFNKNEQLEIINDIVQLLISEI